MGLHLAEISARVTPGKHCALLVDQAGWHVSERLAVPSNITIMPLPAKCPELNPVENVWQFMRDNWLSNRVFSSYDAIVDHCCYAWNQLVDQPWRVMSIGLRDWAMGPRSVSLGITYSVGKARRLTEPPQQDTLQLFDHPQNFATQVSNAIFTKLRAIFDVSPFRWARDKLAEGMFP